MSTFEIVVSAENNRYMQWQAMMFHYSCQRFLKQAPVIVVHDDGEELMDGFRLIQQHGGILQRTPTLRVVDGVEYPPRNTAGALAAVETSADYLVLCDADMVFFRPPAFELDSLSPRTVSFDWVQYLNPDDAKWADEIDLVCGRAGIDPMEFRGLKISGGVPHIVSREVKDRLSERWLELIELFPVIDHPKKPSLPKYSYPKGPHRDWLATMWAVIMAMYEMNLEPIETKWCLNNKQGNQPMDQAAGAGHCMVHYCFDGPGFNKRLFKWDVAVTDPKFWQVEAPDESIDGFLRGLFRETAGYFGICDAVGHCVEAPHG